jgi:hypothetical protein
MNRKMPITRRRKWKRFKIKGGAIVLLHKSRFLDVGKPKLIELGPVIDISMGGLAVQYVENKSRRHDTDVISVAIPSIGVTLPDLQCKVILEKVITELPNGKQIYNRCVEFVNLTKIQNLQLESFIRKHTFHTIPDRRSGKDRRCFNDPNFNPANDRRSGIERRIYVR